MPYTLKYKLNKCVNIHFQHLQSQIPDKSDQSEAYAAKEPDILPRWRPKLAKRREKPGVYLSGGYKHDFI